MSKLIWDKKRETFVPAMEYYLSVAGSKKSNMPCPHIISDSIEVKSMADGQVYSSKSELRRSYKQHGYVEIGNEEIRPPKKPAPNKNEIKDTVKKAFAAVGISD
jgi:hypothetical protein